MVQIANAGSNVSSRPPSCVNAEEPVEMSDPVEEEAPAKPTESEEVAPESEASEEITDSVEEEGVHAPVKPIESEEVAPESEASEEMSDPVEEEGVHAPAKPTESEEVAPESEASEEITDSVEEEGVHAPAKPTESEEVASESEASEEITDSVEEEGVHPPAKPTESEEVAPESEASEEITDSVEEEGVHAPAKPTESVSEEQEEEASTKENEPREEEVLTQPQIALEEGEKATPRRPPIVCCITGTEPSTWKSTTCVEIAWALRSIGRSVAVIDMCGNHDLMRAILNTAPEDDVSCDVSQNATELVEDLNNNSIWTKVTDCIFVAACDISAEEPVEVTSPEFVAVMTSFRAALLQQTDIDTIILDGGHMNPGGCGCSEEVTAAWKKAYYPSMHESRLYNASRESEHARAMLAFGASDFFVYTVQEKAISADLACEFFSSKLFQEKDDAVCPKLIGVGMSKVGPDELGNADCKKQIERNCERIAAATSHLNPPLAAVMPLTCRFDRLVKLMKDNGLTYSQPIPDNIMLQLTEDETTGHELSRTCVMCLAKLIADKTLVNTA